MEYSFFISSLASRFGGAKLYIFFTHDANSVFWHYFRTPSQEISFLLILSAITPTIPTSCATRATNWLHSPSVAMPVCKARKPSRATTAPEYVFDRSEE